MNGTENMAKSFEKCRRALVALGDENRQHLILEMMKTGKCEGVRVGEITERTNLSRPAVSHHLQILKNAGIVKVRRDGTKNYYSFDEKSDTFDALIEMLTCAKSLMSETVRK